MKAITLKQPWAYLVCSGVKNIENRTWKCPDKYIGERVLIHASKKGLTYKEISDYMLNLDCEDMEFQKVLLENSFSKKYFAELPCSAIIGSVRISGCIINHPSVWAEKTKIGIIGDVLDYLKSLGRYSPIKYVYNWILEDAILFDKPILDVKGKLSFWESNCEVLVCPKCGSFCLHNNSDVGVLGCGNPVCECNKCGYMIQEGEFEFVR